MTRVFKRPPMGRNSVTVTRTDGQRLFVHIGRDREEEVKITLSPRVIKSELLLFSYVQFMNYVVWRNWQPISCCDQFV